MEISDRKQTLILENRRRLIIDSVINIESFTDSFLELSTYLGGIEIEGRDLVIEELSQDNGKICIKGEICGFYYKESKKVRSLFKKGNK